MGDSHESVINRVHEGVEGLASRPHKHKVGEATGRECDLSPYEVRKSNVFCRHLEPESRLSAFGNVALTLCLG